MVPEVDHLGVRSEKLDVVVGQEGPIRCRPLALLVQEASVRRLVGLAAAIGRPAALRIQEGVVGIRGGALGDPGPA